MKLLAMLLLGLMLFMPALAENWSGVIPGSTSQQIEERIYRLTVESTGETLLLTVDDAGNPLRLETEIPAQVAAEGEQSRDGAEAAALLEYPAGRVLSSELMEDGSRVLTLLADDLCGTVAVRGDAIVFRALDFGEYAQDGELTYAGAEAALLLLRPGAWIAELELDDNDGMLIYEGEAFFGGVEYEFELNARTGRLLEWERD